MHLTAVKLLPTTPPSLRHRHQCSDPPRRRSLHRHRHRHHDGSQLLLRRGRKRFTTTWEATKEKRVAGAVGAGNVGAGIAGVGAAGAGGCF